MTSANHARLSAILTVSNKRQIRPKVLPGGDLNVKILIDFMKRLVRGRETRVVLILDTLHMHHSKTAEKWLTDNDETIAVFRLPSYSPELRHDELLNASLKQHVTQVVPARNELALRRAAIGTLRSFQKQPERDRNHFGQKDFTYAIRAQSFRAGSIRQPSRLRRAEGVQFKKP